ncbi:DNA methyltransferase [Pseudomonas weihenstephanensis]|uniref:Cytosine-specific methyltransferase n=1 Tax=Pseudomonas weihenstephanensis TaxID=1608994 RepID=A0A0J6ILI5_9PSED|nr:DNA cytosine methyltransferase [Pseudomonas weihenstephanensis]KMN13168.1 DNA methyltransferase [Pseudomonas weihenstephanensis]
MNYIELFAGCGGLSLGLKSVGFDLLMANELSPMAAESYAYNFFKEDVDAQSKAEKPALKRTLWLNSRYPLSDLKLRLREDPRKSPPLGEGYSDLEGNERKLKGSLVVGSIITLNRWLEGKPDVRESLKSGFGDRGVDLVSGGPPCQSFSMAGLRRMDCEKNSLPWEFAKFTESVQPKIVLLENVTGILRPFKDDLGNSHYAWFELAKAFSVIGYVPLCLHVNAKYAGVPQNRPRFILMGVRKDFYDKLVPTFNESEKVLFSQPLSFFEQAKEGKELPYSALDYRDVVNLDDLQLFKNSFLAPLVAFNSRFVTVKDAIDDLRTSSDSEGRFAKDIAKIFGKTLPNREMANHALRSNGDLVRRRFRLYQVLQKVGNDTRKKIVTILKGETVELTDADWKKLSQFDYLIESNEYVTFERKSDFMDFLQRHPTKKQTQKALIADQPAPAALSIPDDACHYHHDELRTLSVREMARIQSFPDSFELRSKVTTGGQMRSFEVPQYTQVGNAVPPLLGRALGQAVSELLSRV